MLFRSVLDRAGTPIYAATGGKSVAPTAYQPLSAGFEPLIERVRGGQRSAAQFARIGGQAYLFVAAGVRPAGVEGRRGPLLLAARPLGPEFLNEISERNLLEDVRLIPGSTTTAPGIAHTELRSLDDQVVGSLIWRPSSPGRQLYTSAILPILLVVCSIAGIAFMTFGRGRRVAQGLIASEARAKHMALHDALTSMPNRVLFTDRLTNALEQVRRRPGAVGVLCLDLDRFKEINDTFGHQFGDELLREVARRLTATCRTSDTVARLGGDEFAIVQPDATGAAAARLASRIQDALSKPIELPVGQVYIGCSIGITIVENSDISPIDAMRQGDLALYAAKDGGRGQFRFFEPEMDAALRMRRAVETDLREALASGGLEMAYQCQVDARGDVVTVEALVRWDHPERGPVQPSFFVPIAEECGLIDQLGNFTLRTAFIDSLRWAEKVKVAVNVSAAQLRLRGFTETVTRLLEETGADPRRFELEITEGVLMGDDPDTHSTLQRLRELGFTLALDDFGTGYSSLSYLRRYPVDKIKIDQSFTAGLGTDLESEAVVNAIVKLGRALNLSVVAEGVETPEQRRRLANAGCADVQGFLYHHPMPAAELDRVIAAGGAPAFAG